MIKQETMTNSNLESFDEKIIEGIDSLLKSFKYRYLLNLLNQEEINDLHRIAKSVIYHKNDIWTGGSFVQAIVDNDLFRATRAADSTMIKCTSFLSEFAHSFYLTPEDMDLV